MPALDFILDFLFPPRCSICGSPTGAQGQICADCWNKFNWIANPKCEKCGYPFPADLDPGKKLLCPDCMDKKKKLDIMRSACVYDAHSRQMMLGFKHGTQLQHADPMSRAMLPLLRELGCRCEERRRGNPAGPPGPDCALNFEHRELTILPVPLAARRLFRRGYNQASLLARPIAKHLSAKIDFDSVRRKYRADMGRKNARQRAEHIRGAFTVRRPDKIKGRAILLVDDVYTTGATFNELAGVLKKAGAAWVGGITFCRAVRAI